MKTNIYFLLLTEFLLDREKSQKITIPIRAYDFYLPQNAHMVHEAPWS